MRIKFIIIFTSLFAKPTVAKMPSAEDLGVLKRMGTFEKARRTCSIYSRRLRLNVNANKV